MSIFEAFADETSPTGKLRMASLLGHPNATTVDYWYRTGKIMRWRKHEVLRAAEKGGIVLTDAQRRYLEEDVDG